MRVQYWRVQIGFGQWLLEGRETMVDLTVEQAGRRTVKYSITGTVREIVWHAPSSPNYYREGYWEVRIESPGYSCLQNLYIDEAKRLRHPDRIIVPSVGTTVCAVFGDEEPGTTGTLIEVLPEQARHMRPPSPPDLTREEALIEAKRLWGGHAYAFEAVGKAPLRVGCAGVAHGTGKTFRKAFADAAGQRFRAGDGVWVVGWRRRETNKRSIMR
jgi:hypothetical protein